MSPRRAVLIVDDEPILLLSIRQELKLRFGGDFIYETALSAEQGMQAIDRLKDEGVSVILIISDLLMPGMRGDDFLRSVHSVWPDIKLVMLSGHSDSRAMERLSEELGLFAFMKKPYARGSLSRLVQSALNPD